ncbi:MAG: VOC family protein [Bryobacterales bacterium]|nr:VOC family protein [Bryobacterales bacterium]
MRIRMLVAATCLAVASQAADVPQWQSQVERMVWVVADTDAVVAGWRKVQLVETMQSQTLNAELRFRGDPVKARLRWTVARFGDTIVDFIQPVEGTNAFRAFHKQHGDGVMALVHRVENTVALEQEIARYAAAGVGILQDYRVPDPSGETRYVLFDTEAGGKYVLGLVAVGGSAYPKALAPPPVKANAQKVTQYAFAVEDLGAVSAYWERLGWPAMAITNPDLLDLQYRGKPESFAMKLGWYRHTKVPYEWIESTKEPNVYVDHMRVHGEGIHHLAFNVPIIDAATADWARRGFPTSQSGAWGEKGKPGSGRFAYLDTQKNGGIDIELLWNYRAPASH